MPVVVFNDKDDLQHELLRRHGVEHGPPSSTRSRPPPTSTRPSASASAGACSPSRRPAPTWPSGALVRLSADVIDVPLYWQRWRLDSPKLAALTAAVRTAAARHLLPGDGRHGAH